MPSARGGGIPGARIREGPGFGGAEIVPMHGRGVAAEQLEERPQARRQRVAREEVAGAGRRRVHAQDPLAHPRRGLAEQAPGHGVAVEMGEQRAHQRAIGQGRPAAEQVGLRFEVGRERVQQRAGVGLDGGRALRNDAENADAPLHAIGEARGALGVARRRREVAARLGLALGEAPAVVHGRAAPRTRRRRARRGRPRRAAPASRDRAAGAGWRRSSSSRIALESWRATSSGVTSTGMKARPVRATITSR